MNIAEVTKWFQVLRDVDGLDEEQMLDTEYVAERLSIHMEDECGKAPTDQRVDDLAADIANYLRCLTGTGRSRGRLPCRAEYVHAEAKTVCSTPDTVGRFDPV